MKLKTALIGLGKIGFLNDLSNLHSNSIPLSHTKAVLFSKALELVVGVDQNKTNRDLFTNLTMIRSVESIEEIKQKVDLVIIAVPTSKHYEVFKATLEILKPKNIILEKPAGELVSETIDMLKEASSAGVKVLIPYFRVYAKEIAELRKRIIQGEKGKIEEVTVIYSHGLKQNGCHFLHLVDYLVGNLDCRAEHVFRNPDNPSWVSYTKTGTKLTFIGLDKLKIRSGEVKITCEKGTYTLINGGRLIVSRDLNLDTGWDELNSKSKFIEILGIQNFYEDIMLKFDDRELISDESERAIRVQSLMSNLERES